ncbi:uncharacterized protein KQ657_004651 [Scheffersomyces spartinae]|uniref:Uncharacterized protein n=1 Tax=Scheffersomyces spartinae TaxID=45513 RepID=A0A9P7VAL7_9ASCO|nr:uncharacterized protein KQ657_004651 [Scheffersomyces spartinae]KAG7194438.1 hypothetical protein KQ657_004651 [Scheffersomyces spartinae]
MTLVTCLSSIPTTPHLCRTEFELSCPVYLLLLWKDDEHGNAIIFTDLQLVTDASIANEERVRCSTEYDALISGGCPGPMVPRNKLFLATVPDDELFSLICKTVRNIVQDQHMDFGDPQRCRVYQYGVLAKIEARLQVLPSSRLVEGTLTLCVCIAPKNVDMVCPNESEQRQRLVQLLKRLKHSLKRDILDFISDRLHINDIIEQSRFNKGQNKIVTRPKGAELVFGHHFDSPTQMTQLIQRPTTESSQEGSSTISSSLSEKSLSPVLSKISINSEGEEENELNAEDIELSDLYPGHLVKRATVESLATIENEYHRECQLDSTLVYNVEAFIIGLLPDIPFVVKPYGRTVKLAPFKLVIRDVEGPAIIMVEFRTSQEIQRFLSLPEPEDSLCHLTAINQKMNAMVGTVKQLSVQVMTTDTQYPRMYWRCMNVLKDMT